MVRVRREDSRIETRRRLLDAARHRFAADGYHATTVERISEEAGFTRGAFYANFADKADIFLTIVEDRTATAIRSLSGAVVGAADHAALPAIRQWYRSIVVDKQFEPAWQEFWPVAIQDDRLRARLVERQRSVRDAVSGLVSTWAEGQSVQLAVEPHRLARIVIALLDGLTAQSLIEDDYEADEVLPLALVLLWTGATADGPFPDNRR